MSPISFTFAASPGCMEIEFRQTDSNSQVSQFIMYLIIQVLSIIISSHLILRPYLIKKVGLGGGSIPSIIQNKNIRFGETSGDFVKEILLLNSKKNQNSNYETL